MRIPSDSFAAGPVAELVFTEEADLALRTLEADPTQGRLLKEIYDVLDCLKRIHATAMSANVATRTTPSASISWPMTG